MAKPEERRVPDERGARAEAAGRAKRGDSAGAATGDAAHGDSDGQDPAVSTCAEADEREVEGATFFANTACRWFPCHETADPEHFDFAYTPSGVKDCSACLLPHRGSGGSAFVLQRADELAALAKRPQ